MLNTGFVLSILLIRLTPQMFAVLDGDLRCL